MLARREALESAGLMDERFFIYSEEVDLCYRIGQAGWEIRHLPSMTILHHAEKAGINPKMEAQLAYASRQYAVKHFALVRRTAYTGMLMLGYSIRSVAGGRNRELVGEKRVASRRALRTLLGLAPPPFGAPPPNAVALRSANLEVGPLKS